AGEAEDDVRNPYSGELVGTVPRASAADVERALVAAVDGAAAMRRLSAHDRQTALERAAELTAARVDDLARTISAEAGKPLTEARGEASRIADLVRLSAAEGARMHGETVPVDAAPNAGGKLGLTLRQPCGVVVAVTPFNYPALLVGHKVYPALAPPNPLTPQPARRAP